MIVNSVTNIKIVYVLKNRTHPGMKFFSPFEPEKEFNVYNSCKCSLDVAYAEIT